MENALLLVLTLIVIVVVLLLVGQRAPPEKRKDHYGNPPGMIRSLHQDELGYRGWADNPGDFEGSSASSVSGYIERSA